VTFDLPFVNTHEFESILADRELGPAFNGDYPVEAQRVGLV
jgi:hypothetical protein